MENNKYANWIPTLVCAILLPGIGAAYPLIFLSQDQTLIYKVAVGLFIMLLLLSMICFVLAAKCSQLNSSVFKSDSLLDLTNKRMDIESKISQLYVDMADSFVKQSNRQYETIATSVISTEEKLQSLLVRIADIEQHAKADSAQMSNDASKQKHHNE